MIICWHLPSTSTSSSSLPPRDPSNALSIIQPWTLCAVSLRKPAAGAGKTHWHRGSMALTTPVVANVTFGEDISGGTARKRCNGDTSAVTCCWAALMRGLVLYVCVSAVCTLGILQNNGLFLALQMCYSQNNVLNVPLFNTNQQITPSSTCRARRIHGAVQIIVEMANILCDCSDSPDADIVST